MSERFDDWWVRNTVRLSVGLLIFSLGALVFVAMHGARWVLILAVLSVGNAARSLRTAFQLQASQRDLDLARLRYRAALEWERDHGDG
jgi:hypothetical protein